MTEPLPPRAGVGFKLEHAQAILESEPDVGWFEVHPENYMVDGGPRHAALGALRARYPLSLHGVGLSLGSVEPPDPDHLAALKRLVDRYDPASVSEHVAWVAHGDLYFGDLLPVTIDDDSLAVLCTNIARTQDALGRRILVENPSHYLRPTGSERDELDFLVAMAQRAGCGLLVDLDNITVSAANVGYDAEAYVDGLPAELIGEVHLAGHTEDNGDGGLLIDTHSRRVPPDVWRLFRRLVARVGPVPTLIEWDNDIPDWPVLDAERRKADLCLEAYAPPQRRSA